jgi:hypothetical protein
VPSRLAEARRDPSGLHATGLAVSGPFRVGIEFTQAGTPSVARDDDGITAGRNFVLASGIGWLEAGALGITGDWIIRATVGEVEETGSEVGNDGWLPGGVAAFQAGFVAGEIAAARLVPSGPFPCAVKGVRFLFGGASGTRTVKLHVWDDAAGTDASGTEIYSGSFQVTASDNALQTIDLSSAGVAVSGPFRVGIEFTQAGTPSVARDDDGITAGRNFVLASGIGWLEAGALGITGDWIIRATVDCAGGVRFVRGDANADGGTDISDGIAILGFLFLGQPAKLSCERSADLDDDGTLDISDAISLLAFKFLGGRSPASPYPNCGTDTTPDALACASFAPCP